MNGIEQGGQDGLSSDVGNACRIAAAESASLVIVRPIPSLREVRCNLAADSRIVDGLYIEEVIDIVGVLQRQDSVAEESGDVMVEGIGNLGFGHELGAVIPLVHERSPIVAIDPAFHPDVLIRLNSLDRNKLRPVEAPRDRRAVSQGDALIVRRIETLQQGICALNDHSALASSVCKDIELLRLSFGRIDALNSAGGVGQVIVAEVSTILVLLQVAQNGQIRRDSGIRLGILVESLTVTMSGQKDNARNGRHEDWKFGLRKVRDYVCALLATG